MEAFSLTGRDMRRLLPAVVYCLILAGLLVLAACAVNPVSGQQQLAFMSEDQELQMGRAYLPQAVQTFGGLPPDDELLQSYVQRVGTRLALSSHRPKLPWEFVVVNDSMINAFALPGGKICITRGLIAKMSSEDELAAVLGHEIGHVTARHAVSSHARGTLVGLGAAGLGAALAGLGMGQSGGQLASVAGNMLMMSYSRDQERQSDELGYKYMVLNRYNPKGMVGLFEIFQRTEKTAPGTIQSFFSSHPLTAERVNTARSRVQTSDPGLVAQPLKTRDFELALSRQKSRAAAYEAYDKGRRQMSQKSYAPAVEFFQKGIERFNGDGLFYAELAQAQYHLGQVEQARISADRGTERSPDVFTVNFIAGVLNLETGRSDQAMAPILAANRILPSHPGAKFILGVAFEKSGKAQNAVSTYRQAVRLDPQGQAGKAAAARLARMGYRP